MTLVTSVPFYPLREYLAQHRNWVEDAATSVIDSGYVVGGEAVEKFESDFAGYTGAKYSAGVANGLDAIRLSLQALGVGPGDEVIVPAFTFIATWLAVTQVGATPIAVDVDVDTAGMKLSNLPITKKTKALIFVHLYGYPTDLTTLSSELKIQGIFLLEDCAQAQGAIVAGKHVGTFGDAGCFSFYPTKNLGAIGDAGGVITNDENLAKSLKSLRSYGFGSSKYDHISIGMNSRLDPIQATFLSFRLQNLNQENADRNRIGLEIAKSIGNSKSITPLERKTTGTDAFHLFVVTCKVNRDLVQNRLALRGIQTDIHYPKAIHQQECYLSSEYRYLAETEYPVSEYLAANVLSLPNFPWMSDERLEYLSDSLTTLNI